MNFNHLLLTSIPQTEKLVAYGFEQKDDSFILKKSLNADFYTVVVFSKTDLIAEVFETDTDEKYFLVDVKTAHGAFVNSLRSMVSDLINQIVHTCFSNTDIKFQYIDFLENELTTKGDYPWEGDTTSAVYRCKNQKWFALVMKIKFKNLGFESEEPVWAVNIKADAEKIPDLVDHKSIFPAYHMNKKYWITVILTSVTDFEKLKQLTLRSKELVEKA